MDFFFLHSFLSTLILLIIFLSHPPHGSGAYMEGVWLGRIVMALDDQSVWTSMKLQRGYQYCASLSCHSIWSSMLRLINFLTFSTVSGFGIASMMCSLR